MKLSDLAAAIGGEISGDGTVEIVRVASLEDAGEGALSYLADAAGAERLRKSNAAAFIVPAGIEGDGRPLIAVKNPSLAFASAVELFHPKPLPKGVLPGAHVAEGVMMGRGVSVYPNAYIGEGTKIGEGTTVYPGVYIGARCEIGKDCTFYPNAAVMDGTVIGDRVVLQGGAVIGGDGYGFIWDGNAHRKVPQIGRVVIGDDVEIGANSTIDRATLGETVIGRGTKIDNLVMVAHNCRVGEHVLLVSQVGISGSVQVGNNAILAGQVGVAGHLKIGDGVIAAAKTGITKDVEPGAKISGYPPLPHMEWLRLQNTIMKLPEMRKALQEMEKRLKKLEQSEAKDV